MTALRTTMRRGKASRSQRSVGEMQVPLPPTPPAGSPARRGRLFSVRDPMTTEEISRMGFTNVILLNADRWRSDEGSVDVSSAAAAGDIHYCFGMKVFPRDPSHAPNVHLHVQCSGRVYPRILACFPPLLFVS